MTAIAITDLVRMSQEYQQFENAYGVAGSALQAVITAGTVMYNDASFAQEFPTTFAAYQQYLVTLQSSINTFISSLPAAPALSG